ncbi:poly(A) polymerase [Acrasis kona]|uniref:Poly(A) polymerase n=1 Tax=Acrasis kona TaxID=1008807 RepID=A0AAW2YI79_9EUKA
MKAFHTACCIIPPQEVWPQIQAIRKKHDASFVRWPPHVNLFFPFVETSEFEDKSVLLEKALSNIEPFKIRLETFDHFSHAKKNVLWLKPQDDSGECEKVKSVCRECANVLSGVDNSRPYNPHLSMGQFPKDKNFESVREKFQSGWEPIEFLCSEIYLISRDGKDDPMHIRKIVPIGKNC